MDETLTLAGPTFESRLRAPSAVALAGAVLAIVSVLAILAGGWGNRAGWWDYRVALGVLRWAAFIGIAGGLIAGIGGTLAMSGAPPRRVSVLAIVGVVLGALLLGIPWAYQSRRTAPINDITTDTV